MRKIVGEDSSMPKKNSPESRTMTMIDMSRQRTGQRVGMSAFVPATFHMPHDDAAKVR
jgi:hypothetical protein